MPDSGLRHYPQTVPARTIVGRLANTAGPTEAIPLDILAGALGFTTLSTTALLLSAYALGVPLAANAVVETAGRDAVGDRGGSKFYYDASDTTTADNGGTVRVDVAGRRWKAITDEPGNVRLFGAKGDGGNDQTAITKAVNAICATGGRILFPAPGDYRGKTASTNVIRIPANTNGVTVVVEEGASVTADNLSGGNATASLVYVVGPASNLTFDIGGVMGFASQSTGVLGYSVFSFINQAASDANSSWALDTETLMEAKVIRNVRINGGLLLNSPGVGIEAGGVDGIWLNKVKTYNTMADGFFWDRCKNVHVIGCDWSMIGDDDISGHRVIPPSAFGYKFTITSGNASAGATYTNNGETFTVFGTIASKTVLVAMGTGAPASSGTLTKATGGGDATLTFSAVVAPPTYAPTLYTGADGAAYTFNGQGSTYVGNTFNGENPTSGARTSGAALAFYGVCGITASGNTSIKKTRGIQSFAGHYSASVAFLASRGIQVDGTVIEGAANNVRIDGMATQPGFSDTLVRAGISITNTRATRTTNNGIQIIDASQTGGALGGWVRGVVIDGYIEEQSTATNLFWNILRCTDSKFTRFSTDQYLNVDTGLTGDPYGFASNTRSNLTIQGQARSLTLAGVFKVNLDFVSEGAGRHALEMTHSARIDGTFEVNNPQAGSTVGDLNFGTNAKDVHLTSLRGYFPVDQSQADLVVLTADNNICIDDVFFYAAKANATNGFCTGANYGKFKSWQYVAAGTDTTVRNKTRGSFNLASGTKTITNNFIGPNTHVVLNNKSPVNPGILTLGTVTDGVEFVVNSIDPATDAVKATDASLVTYELRAAA